MKDSLFAPEAGHPEIQQKILSSFHQNRLSHAFLFHGPEGCGKDAFAIAVAQYINCSQPDGQMDRTSPQYLKIAHLQHPDVKFIFSTPARSNVKEEDILEALREKAKNPYRRVIFSGKNTFIGIDTVRELKYEARYKLYEGRKKVFIISEAENMRVEAANALLKLLEEPPDNLMLVLTTSNVHKILPTIRSRCQLLRFSQLPEEKIQSLVTQYADRVDALTLPLIIRLSGFNIKRTFDFLERDVLSLRDQAIDLLRRIVLIHRAQELMQIVEPIAAKKDREEARLLLWLLLLWFQDILHLQKLDEKGQTLFNKDKKEVLEKFLSFTPDADITAIVWDIQEALQNLDDPRNYNPLLILTTLAIKLNKKIKNS
jgi:DNA polymerase-3 subunit delta'